VALYLQFIFRGVAARSLQDALIWLSGLAPKRLRRSTHCLWGPNEQLFGLIYQIKADHL